MNASSPARGGARLTGVIDTLSAGYGVVNRHPWILLMPVLLDLFLWLGPQVSAARLMSQALGRAALLSPNRAALLGQDQQRDLVAAAESFNLLSALAPSVIGVPSFVAAVGIRDPLHSVYVGSWGAALALLLGAWLGGSLLGSLYYTALAAGVLGEPASPGRLVPLALRAWGRVLAYLVLLAGIALLFGLPVGFLALSAVLVAPALGSLIMTAVVMALTWAAIYLFFAPEAIFLSRVGPLQAIRNSVAVVRLNFWGAFAIIILITIILLGMGRVWDLSLDRFPSPWGIGIGIIGNAYISTGLIAASFQFYRERIEYLRPPARSVEAIQSLANGDSGATGVKPS